MRALAWAVVAIYAIRAAQHVAALRILAGLPGAMADGDDIVLPDAVSGVELEDPIHRWAEEDEDELPPWCGYRLCRDR